MKKSINTEKQIQKLANVKFPADEIWKNGDSFWAFKKGQGIIYSTMGNWLENHIDFRTEDIWSNEPDIKLKQLVEEKIKEGYKCFAILL